MKRSDNAILTTHCGSLPRPPELRELLFARDRGQSVDGPLFATKVREAVAAVVRQQIESGITVVNDGEASKVGFAAYVSDRLSGFEGPPQQRPKTLVEREFPEYMARRGGQMTRQSCNAPVSWKDFSLVENDIENLKLAMKAAGPVETFMTAASPGTITNHHPNQHYPDREEYIYAVAEVMKREYEAIANAGLVLQLDCPDLGLHNTWFPDLSLQDFQKEIALNVEAMNHATRDIPPERLRIHVCWGAGEGPHNHDPELSDIVDVIAKARATAISIVGANGRHEHEWRVWKGKLPDEKVLIPGVIDNTTNFIEHPEVVADRIVNYANVVGRERVIAGVDCGFATGVSANPAVDPQIAWAKLHSLAVGAEIATKELWGR
jgi:5-methyltetrahydropteroyltriglutamate--homocysteine methyltransferase